MINAKSIYLTIYIKIRERREKLYFTQFIFIKYIYNCNVSDHYIF